MNNEVSSSEYGSDQEEESPSSTEGYSNIEDGLPAEAEEQQELMGRDRNALEQESNDNDNDYRSHTQRQSQPCPSSRIGNDQHVSQMQIQIQMQMQGQHQRAQFQAVPPSSLFQPQHQSPLTAHAAPYAPAVTHPVSSIPSMLPAVPVMNMPMPMNINMNMNMNNGIVNAVDPLFQVQFYEARMRDHAAAFAQYANAAAGAALAAAHMATASSATGSISGTFYPNHLQNSMPFYPNANVNDTSSRNVNVQHLNERQHQHQHQNQSRQSFGVPTNTNTASSSNKRSNQGAGADIDAGVTTHSGNKHNFHNANTTHRNRRLPTETDCPQQHQHQYQSNRRTRRRREHNTNNPNPWASSSASASASASASRQHQNSGKKPKRSSIKSFDLMGKTGVSALHDLCNKKRWSQPKITHIPIDLLRSGSEDGHGQGHDGGQTSTTSTATHDVEFIMSVEVNGVELSRGRGGSKKSAQQDAARKALSVLYPGCSFDANGILLDLGKMDETCAFLSSAAVGQGRGQGQGQGQGRSRSRYDHDHDQSNCLKDLEANMASRLSIDGNNLNSNGRLSPDPSEDSSISTTVSMAKGKPAPLVTGGPFIQMNVRARNRLAFPSASTTSGVSSASEDVDDDEYLASRGASVCSALLNVMVQIDKRIRDQPIYTFDVCANPATIAQQQQQQQQETQRNAKLGGQKCSTKRKGEGFSGVGGAIVSKRRSATNAVGRMVTIHRSSFACTASLTLYTEMGEAPQMVDNKCITPKGEQKTTSNKDEHEQTLIGKVADNSQATNEGTKVIEEGKNNDFRSAEKPPKPARKSSSESTDEISIERLQAVGTGATKREARHIASAKLLAMLFPDCNGMVEVKAASEAAREQYAANRARLKRAAQSDGGKFAKRDTRRKVKNEANMIQEKLSLAYPQPNDPPIPDWFSSRISLYTDKIVRKKVDSAPTSDGMAKLSLSESGDRTDDVKDATQNDTSLQISRQRQFEEKIDAALQLLHENDDDKKPPSSSFKDNELSKTILRRATTEDVESLERLLRKEDNEQNGKATLQTLPATFSSISPLSLIGISTKSSSQVFDHNIDISTTASQLWGSQSVVLILSRAIASQDEPPLGCAVLSLGFSLAKGRLLRISEIRNEIHFPKERLIECLEELGNKMECTVEVRNQKKEINNGIFFTAENLQTIVQKYAKKEGVDSESSAKHTSIHRPLQSVKEEDNEDDDAKSDQLHHKRAKLV